MPKPPVVLIGVDARVSEEAADRYRQRVMAVLPDHEVVVLQGVTSIAVSPPTAAVSVPRLERKGEPRTLRFPPHREGDES